MFISTNTQTKNKEKHENYVLRRGGSTHLRAKLQKLL